MGLIQSNPQYFDADHELSAPLRSTLRDLERLFIRPQRLKIKEGNQVGVGGFGEVMLATLDKSREVAVKQLKVVVHKRDRKRLALHLARELRIWATLQHPNILGLLGYYLSKNYEIAQLISVYMVNGNVSQYLNQNQPDITTRLKFVQSITSGLQYLHDFTPPISHGDLKPANVLISDEIDAVICDFGVASFINQAAGPSGLTTTQAVKGSLRYMSPELLDEEGKHTLPSDIWAWACTTYEIFTNIEPYSEAKTNLAVIVEMSRSTTPGSIQILLSRLPQDEKWPTRLSKAINDCWNFDSSKRPSVTTLIGATKYPSNGELEGEGTAAATSDRADVRQSRSDTQTNGPEQAMSGARNGRADIQRLEPSGQGAIEVNVDGLQMESVHPKVRTAKDRGGPLLRTMGIPFSDNSRSGTNIHDHLTIKQSGLVTSANPKADDQSSLKPSASVIRLPSFIARPQPTEQDKESPYSSLGSGPQPPRRRFSLSELRNGLLSANGKRSTKLDASDCTKRLSKRTGPKSIGGFSDVSQAWLGNRLVAVKELRATGIDGIDEIRMRKRLGRKIYVWASLHHPYVLEFLGFAFEYGRPCLISPWCEHETLQEYLQKYHGADRRLLVRQIAEGLKYLHVQDPPVIHGNLKTTNILITDKHIPKICDFGCSKRLGEGGTGFTTADLICTTIRYSAPEILLNQHHSLQSDVYSFACVALETMTDKCPFWKLPKGFAGINRVVSENKAPSPGDHPELEDDKLWELLRRCWSYGPSDRPTMITVCNKLAEEGYGPAASAFCLTESG